MGALHQETEAAQDAAGRQKPKRIEARRQHEDSGGAGHRDGRPSDTGGLTHYDAARDNQTSGHRNERGSQRALPVRFPKSMHLRRGSPDEIRQKTPGTRGRRQRISERTREGMGSLPELRRLPAWDETRQSVRAAFMEKLLAALFEEKP